MRPIVTCNLVHRLHVYTNGEPHVELHVVLNGELHVTMGRIYGELQ